MSKITISPDLGTATTLWRLLVVLLAERAPDVETILSWSWRDRDVVRRWADRELERYIIGPEGCPSLRTPDVLGVALLINAA